MKTQNVVIGKAHACAGWTRLGALAAVCGLLVGAACGCGSRTSEFVGGETHWLASCGEQDDCGDGLNCICGRCTISCSSDAVCRDFAARAACLPTKEVALAQGCDGAPRRICGELPPDVTADESALDAASSSMDGSEVTATMTDGSSEGASSASTQVGSDSGPPSTIDELPTPEGWDGLKLIDPYSDECVITETHDRNSEPYGEEGDGYLKFSCGGGTEITTVCMLGDSRINGSRLWACYCSGGGGRTASSSVSFEDTGLTETKACRIAGALCVTELPAEVARAQETCTPRSLTPYPDSCRREDDCVRTVTLGDMVLEQTLENEANCSFYDGDVAWCSCLGVLPSGYRFSVSPAMTDESCDVAANLCDDGVDAGTLGVIECALDPQLSSSDELWCDEIYECVQPALVDGRAVEFLGPQLRGRCDHDTPSDSWECSCGGEELPTSLSAPDAATACQLNLQRCLELLSDDVREW